MYAGGRALSSGPRRHRIYQTRRRHARMMEVAAIGRFRMETHDPAGPRRGAHRVARPPSVVAPG